MEESVKEETKNPKCCNCKCQNQNVDLVTNETEIGVQETIRVVKTPLEGIRKEQAKTDEFKTEEFKTEEFKTEEFKTEEKKTEETSQEKEKK